MRKYPMYLTGIIDRIVLIPLAFLFTISTCHGQVPKMPFPDSGAVFTYLFMQGWGVDRGEPFTYRHTRDTIMFDHRIRLNRKVMVFDGDGLAKGTNRYLSKDTSNVVWFCLTNSQTTCHEWFNFNKGVGDKNFRGTISSMDLMTNQGITRRRMHIGHGTSIIEGIGPTDGWPIPFEHHEMITSIVLLCFSVGDSVTYVNPDFGTCDTSWHIDLANSELSIFPHRMVSVNGNHIWVETPVEWNGKDLQIQVLDVSGKVILTQSLNSTKLRIPLVAKKGVYLYAITGSGEVLERGKLLLR